MLREEGERRGVLVYELFLLAPFDQDYRPILPTEGG